MAYTLRHKVNLYVCGESQRRARRMSFIIALRNRKHITWSITTYAPRLFRGQFQTFPPSSPWLEPPPTKGPNRKPPYAHCDPKPKYTLVRGPTHPGTPFWFGLLVVSIVSHTHAAHALRCVGMSGSNRVRDWESVAVSRGLRQSLDSERSYACEKKIVLCKKKS